MEQQCGGDESDGKGGIACAGAGYGVELHAYVVASQLKHVDMQCLG